MKHPNPNILLYIAMADAYALAVEYVDQSRHPELFEEALLTQRYLQHPVHHQAPGNYSDDAEMSAANAEVLLRSHSPFTKLQFAQAYIRQFNAGGRRKGYARHFQAFLEKTPNGVAFLRNIRPHSDKNGAAMRSVPIGVLRTPKEVVEIAKIQAQLTHDTPAGIFSAQSVALISHYALYEDGPFTDLDAYLQKYLPRSSRHWIMQLNASWSGGVADRKKQGGEGVGINTVHAVYQLLLQGESLIDIMQRLIRYGGDTDSVAAIAWGIASTRMQDEVIPDFLEACLEQGNPHTGAVYLKTLGAGLMAKYS